MSKDLKVHEDRYVHIDKHKLRCYLYFFFEIGLFVLLISSINALNISSEELSLLFSNWVVVTAFCTYFGLVVLLIAVVGTYIILNPNRVGFLEWLGEDD